MGSAGSGKGTQGENLVRAFGYEHVQTGDIIRAKAQEDSPLGRKVKENDDKGKHASDELMTELLIDYLQTIPQDQPLLLDGYPRTSPQLKLLDRVLTAVGRDPKTARAIFIKVSLETAARRLNRRAVCTGCKKVYPSRDSTVCEVCGAEVKARVYDTSEGINERLRFFSEQTIPVIEQYRREQRLIEIDGEPSTEQVWANLKLKIDGLI